MEHLILTTLYVFVVLWLVLFTVRMLFDGFYMNMKLYLTNYSNHLYYKTRHRFFKNQFYEENYQEFKKRWLREIKTMDHNELSLVIDEIERAVGYYPAMNSEYNLKRNEDLLIMKWSNDRFKPTHLDFQDIFTFFQAADYFYDKGIGSQLREYVYGGNWLMNDVFIKTHSKEPNNWHYFWRRLDFIPAVIDIDFLTDHLNDDKIILHFDTALSNPHYQPGQDVIERVLGHLEQKVKSSRYTDIAVMRVLASIWHYPDFKPSADLLDRWKDIITDEDISKAIHRKGRERLQEKNADVLKNNPDIFTSAL